MLLLMSLMLLVGGILQNERVKQENEHDKLRVRCSGESKKRFGVEALRIGGDIEPPDRLVDSAPNFPELPRGTTVSLGVWIGEILIAPDGAVADTWSVREFQLNPPFPAFNQAIHTALRKWKYDPIIVEGERMPVCMTVTVNINLS
jgi:hypothetical protein